MRKSRFSEAQIAEILKEGESGVSISDLIRKHGISRPTYFNWRAKYGGISVSELKRLKDLEAENAKLKAENEKMWPNVWQWVAREEDIPKPGDVTVYENAGRSFLVIRQADDPTREAMRQAPHDPVINGYYLTTLGQREATLRQLSTALPASLRANSF